MSIDAELLPSPSILSTAVPAARTETSSDRSLVVNHVMSNDVTSGIFKSIIGYFKEYSDDGIAHIVSARPVEGASIYHYHRPNLEKSLAHPSIITVHHDVDDTDRWFNFNNFIRQYNDCTGLVCLNSRQKSRLMEFGIPERKISIIPHGFNHRLLCPKTPELRNWDKLKLNIGIVSKRYGRRVKGEAYLFELAKRLDPQKVRFTLTGEDRTITAGKLRRLGFQCVAFDNFPYRMIQSLYEDIDALLMCSFYEGGPANIPEALATGTPIFSSAVGMSIDCIRDGENGIILTLDPDEDAARLSGLMSNGFGKFGEIVRSARNRPVQPMTWKEVTHRYSDLYHHTVATASRP